MAVQSVEEKVRMSRMGVTIDWSVIDDDQALQTIQPAAGTEPRATKPVPDAAAQGERCLAALALTLFVLLAAGWVWHTWQVGIRPIEEEVALLARQELQAVEPERLRWVAPPVAEAANRVGRVQFAPEFADLHMTIQEGDTTEHTTLSTRVISLRDNVALVEVVTREVGEAQSYWQTRMYRRTDKGWQRRTFAGEVYTASRPPVTSIVESNCVP